MKTTETIDEDNIVDISRADFSIDEVLYCISANSGKFDIAEINQKICRIRIIDSDIASLLRELSDYHLRLRLQVMFHPLYEEMMNHD